MSYPGKTLHALRKKFHRKEFNFRQTAMSKKRPRIYLKFCSKEKEFLFGENSNFFRTKSDFPSDKFLARPKYAR